MKKNKFFKSKITDIEDELNAWIYEQQAIKVISMHPILNDKNCCVLVFYDEEIAPSGEYHLH